MHAADRIFEVLKDKYGADSVFRDVDSIRAGRDFRTVLKQYLYQTDVLLAIIGKSWVDIKDPSGQRRLDRNDDYLRQEIRTALEREIPVIPLLVDGAKMPSSQDLPSDLEKLAYCQAINIRANRDFEPDMDLLMRTLVDELHIPAEGQANKPRPARRSAPKPEQATPPPQKLQTTPPDDRIEESVVERPSAIRDIDLALSDTSLSIDSASSAGSWYICLGNRVTGPFTEEDLRAIRRRGEFAPTQEVSTDRTLGGPPKP